MVVKEQDLFKDPKLLRDFCFLDFAWDWRVHKAGFPLGRILRAERNFSLSFLISSTREITGQRKIPLRAENSA